MADGSNAVMGAPLKGPTPAKALAARIDTLSAIATSLRSVVNDIENSLDRFVGPRPEQQAQGAGTAGQKAPPIAMLEKLDVEIDLIADALRSLTAHSRDLNTLV